LVGAGLFRAGLFTDRRWKGAGVVVLLLFLCLAGDGLAQPGGVQPGGVQPGGVQPGGVQSPVLQVPVVQPPGAPRAEAIACSQPGRGPAELQAMAEAAIHGSVARFPPLRSADSFIVPDRGRVRFELARGIAKDTDLRLFAIWDQPVRNPGGPRRDDGASPLNRPGLGDQVTLLLRIHEIEREADKTLLRIELPSVGFDYFPWARITVLACSPGEDGTVQFASQVDVRVASRMLAATAALVVPLLFWGAAGWLTCRGKIGSLGWRAFDPVVIAQDPLRRASLARFQILAFTAVTLCLLTYIAMRTGLPGDVSSDVMVLLGITGGGSLASAVVGNRGGGIGLALTEPALEYVRKEGWLNRSRLPGWPELVMHQGTLDIYRLQSLAFTLVVGYALLDTGFLLLAFYDVPDGLMTLLGISQGTYVAGKAIEQQADSATLQARIDRLLALEPKARDSKERQDEYTALNEEVKLRFQQSLGFDDAT